MIEEANAAGVYVFGGRVDAGLAVMILSLVHEARLRCAAICPIGYGDAKRTKRCHLFSLNALAVCTTVGATRSTTGSEGHMASKNLRDLTRQFAGMGRVEAIFLRPARLAAVASVSEAVAEPGRGLIGDRRSAASRLGEQAQKREVSLIQAEHVPVLASWLGLPLIDPARLRRNLVVSGINLLSMRSPFADIALQWQIGDEVVLEITGPCEPCTRMESELGPGGYNAMRGHGGATARIIVGGTIRLADSVRLRV